VPSKVPTNIPGAVDDGSYRESPIEYVQTVLIAFLQGLFYAAPTGGYHWEPTEESEIYISDEKQISGDVVGMRPAITVTVGPAQFFGLGLDDMLDYDQRSGKKTKSVIIPGTMAVNCLSRVPAECTRLAWTVGEQLWMHREFLMRENSGLFEIGRSPAFGAPSAAGSLAPNDGGKEFYVVTTTLPYQIYRTSVSSPLNREVVQNIQALIRARLRPLATGYAGAVQQGDSVDPPFLVEGQYPPSFAPLASDARGNTPNPGSCAPEPSTFPHPLNPAQRVVIRGARPNSPALRPPSIKGRTIPLLTTGVEESCGKQADEHVTDTSTVKV